MSFKKFLKEGLKAKDVKSFDKRFNDLIGDVEKYIDDNIDLSDSEDISDDIQGLAQKFDNMLLHLDKITR